MLSLAPGHFRAAPPETAQAAQEAGGLDTGGDRGADRRGKLRRRRDGKPLKMGVLRHRPGVRSRNLGANRGVVLAEAKLGELLKAIAQLPS
jgi:hypothetical protein